MDRENQVTVTATTKKKPRYFYGWNIVAASFMAHLSYAEHHSSLLGFFFKPLQNEFGWTRSALAAVQTIARLVEALFAPVVGPIAMNAVFDILGSYRPAFIVITGLFALAALLMSATRPPIVRRYATATEMTS